MISSERLSPGTTVKLVLRASALGVLFAFVWSGLVGLLNGPLLLVVFWMYTGRFFPDQIASYIPANLIWGIPLFVLVCLFAAPSGCLLAWLLIRRAMQNVLEERQATRMGRLVAAAAALVLNIGILAMSWRPLSPAGVNIIGETNQSLMTDNTLFLIWAVIGQIAATAFGGWAGKQLRRRLYLVAARELKDNLTT